ncbi:unnamed protein product [Citrullus colocynthis]|uniref:Uncharacterized protein n=1 Tax=Citrullus colocynthis TaxID=252529 RepID=A0ABP0XZR0_9ROSI
MLWLREGRDERISLTLSPDPSVESSPLLVSSSTAAARQNAVNAPFSFFSPSPLQPKNPRHCLLPSAPAA